MIRPVSALTPKVAGKVSFKKNDEDLAEKTRRHEAIVNSAGVSLVTGAFTTLVMRTCTSSWKNASFLGAGAAAVCSIFMIPNFLAKTSAEIAPIAKEATNKKSIIPKPKINRMIAHI